MSSNIQLFNMDCMEAMKQMPDKAFDLAIVDPPYGINHAQIAGKQSGKQYGNAAAAKATYAVKDWDRGIPPPRLFRSAFQGVERADYLGGKLHGRAFKPKDGMDFLG